MKYFNFIFYFNVLKYFNFIFYFNIFKKSNFEMKLILKKINFKSKKIFNNNNYINMYFNLFFVQNVKKYNFILHNSDYVNYKNLINIIYNFNIKKLNYLIFDNSRYLHNLYVNMYSLKDLLIYKNYFYTNPNHFTHKNFIYFYNQFLINKKIFMIIIFNLKYILNFSHILESLDIVLFTFNNKFSFLNLNYNLFIDVNFYKIYLYILLFNQIWILSLNYTIYSNRLLYFRYFNLFRL